MQMSAADYIKSAMIMCLLRRRGLASTLKIRLEIVREMVTKKSNKISIP